MPPVKDERQSRNPCKRSRKHAAFEPDSIDEVVRSPVFRPGSSLCLQLAHIVAGHRKKNPSIPAVAIEEILPNIGWSNPFFFGKFEI